MSRSTLYYLASECFYFFFFNWCAAHRDLHSFPTRRSSDLGRPRRAEPGLEPAGIAIAPLELGQRAAHPVRSEEHTSELQSRFDLVCRLLLEKKKHNASPPIRGPRLIPRDRYSLSPCTRTAT